MTYHWDTIAPLLAVLTPLVGVPLTVITFYLRSLREQQIAWHADLCRRLTALENAITELRRTIDNFERDYTTKAEWLRECNHTRRALEKLAQRAARLSTRIDRHVQYRERKRAGPKRQRT